MKKLSKLISIVLALVMCLTLCPQAAFAADLTTDGGSATTPVVLNVTPAIFSVTVPTGLPITMTADGQIETADSAKIINNSAGAVKVTNVAVEGQNDWTIVDFGTDPTTFKVDEKKVGLQINTMAEITADDGSFSFDATKWSVMTATDGADGGDDEYEFTYDAIVAPQSNAVTDTTVANVVFTVGWYKAEPVINDETVTFTWDGNTDGLVSAAISSSVTLYKVSDATPPMSAYENGFVLAIVNNGTDQSVVPVTPSDPIWSQAGIVSGDGWYSLGQGMVVIALEDDVAASANGTEIILPEKGVYFSGGADYISAFAPISALS